MYLGKSAGSAMPLMWAHAEYIKLLRSISDGQIFDLIPIVAERYQRGHGRKDLEVWKASRRVRAILAGSVLRILSAGPFRLRWSLDNSHPAGNAGLPAGGAGKGNPPAMQEAASTPSGLGLEYVDIPTRAGQAATLRFAFVEISAALLEDTVHEVQLKPDN